MLFRYSQASATDFYEVKYSTRILSICSFLECTSSWVAAKYCCELFDASNFFLGCFSLFIMASSGTYFLMQGLL